MEITLPQHSLNLLQQVLSVPGWASTPQDVYSAGKLLVEVLPELEPRPTEPSQVAELTWCDKVRTFSITEKQRATIVKCLTATAKDLPITRFGHSAKLLEAFGLGE